ncbi:MAG: flagellar protein FlaG [Candidatus Aminicenantes bacterium]|nr:MAG: flagellar protein FlaG [Candidatus Aminicenantes bacterium]
MSEIGEVPREGPRQVAPVSAGRAGRAGAEAGPAVGGALDGRVSTVNATLAQAGVRLRFQLSRESDEVVILVVDVQTGDVVREIPPEYFRRASEGFVQGALRGLLLDEGF